MKKLEPLCTFDRKTKWAASMENSMEGPQKKIKIELPGDPAILLLGIYPEELNPMFLRDVSTLLVICSL